MRYALLLRYDGSACRGVWRQPGSVTVGAVLDQAFARLGEPQAIAQPAARTDAGVHAVGQVAQVECSRNWDPGHLAHSLTAQLPPWITCPAAAVMPEAWHAVHDSCGKTYRYAIDLGEPDPFRQRFCWRPPAGVDPRLLVETAAVIPTRLQADAFHRRGDQRTDLLVDGLVVRWHRRESLVIASIRGRRFTYRLVRSLVGGMVGVAYGACSLDDWRRSLVEGVVTPAAQQQAPAHGLWLWRVHYDRGIDWRFAAASLSERTSS